MTLFGKLVVFGTLIFVAALGWGAYELHTNRYQAHNDTATTTPQTYGMQRYTDTQYDFSFWYPADLQLNVNRAGTDTKQFPGGTEREVITIGQQGGTSIIVVDSTSSTITDEPIPHASPIAATKYFWNAASSTWMVAYPEGAIASGGKGATTTADASKKTIGSLPMLASGRRFDTTIIPLSATRFIVVTDGGGSAFTTQLAATVTSLARSAATDPNVERQALQAEQAAYQQMK